MKEEKSNNLNDGIQNNEPLNKENSDNNNLVNSNENQFSAELNSESQKMILNQFVKKQEEYKQLTNSINIELFENPYLWRIGFGRRLGAYLIDMLFYVFLLIIVAMVTGVADEMIGFIEGDYKVFLSSPEQLEGFKDFISKSFVPLSIAVTFVYYSLEIFFAQSLGKMLLGIVIGSADKKFTSYSKLLLRFILKNISTVFSLIFR